MWLWDSSSSSGSHLDSGHFLLPGPAGASSCGPASTGIVSLVLYCFQEVREVRSFRLGARVDW